MNAGPAHKQALEEFSSVNGDPPAKESKSPGGAPAKRKASKSAGVPLSPVNKKTWKGRKSGSVRETIQYVFDHLPFPLGELSPKDAPGPGAWGLLVHCKTNPRALEEFYTKTWPKILPSKTELDRLERFADDGRETLGLISKIRRLVDGGDGEK